ncbi:MAG: DUF1351 domain-containing protein [Coprobacillus cateniformis]|nr:DUF1351 domain-containing protein [Coprobacillus cateniformis]
MEVNKIQGEFLGCMSAIVVENNEQFLKLREFMGIKNLFLSDGTPVTQLNLNITGRTAFYRDELGMFVGYDHPANIGCNYSLKEFNEAFAEQRTLFGDSSAPGIRPPEEDLMYDVIETQATEVKNELSLAETLNQLEIGEIKPATVTGNIIDFKDKVIIAVNKYKDIVVTKDNFKELTATRADLNNKKAAIIENRKNMKKEALKNVNAVYEAMSEIINAIDSVVNPLDADIKNFEGKEKQVLKQSIYEKTINPMLSMLIKNNMLDDNIAKKFEFDMSWINKGAFTAKGDLTKKTKDGINAEMERLTNLFAQQKNDIATIESTVKQLSIAHKLESELKADTYIELYKKGTSMPAVQERMNQDIEVIKRAVDTAVEKNAQNIHSQPQTIQDDQQVETPQNVADTKNVTVLSDEKTGEVLAKGDNQKLMALVAQTPEKQQGKMFEYTYTFSGSFGAIKTFSNILKLLSMMFKDFKYERK